MLHRTMTTIYTQGLEYVEKKKKAMVPSHDLLSEKVQCKDLQSHTLPKNAMSWLSGKFGLRLLTEII